MRNSGGKEYLKEHPNVRNALRLIGIILIVLGLILLVTGILEEKAASDRFRENFWNHGYGQRESINSGKAWMIFVGMICLFLGFVCTGYGFMGAVSRYQASEVAPVIKDTTNYLIDGTKDEVSDLIRRSISKPNVARLGTCPRCKDPIDDDELYCDNCGNKLSKTCTACNTENDSNKSYCKKCGRKL